MLPSNLQIYGTPSASQIKVTGGSNAAMAVYAPNADVTITGGGQIYGALYGKTVTNTGGAEIHFDLALQNLNTAGVSGTSGAWKMSGMYHP